MDTTIGDGLDELFGDDSLVQLPVAIDTGLLHRVDQLAIQGCQQ